MRIISPYVGENVADVCRRAYFETVKSDEPLIVYFNDTMILFTKDKGGIHHKDHDIDTAKVEYMWGMNVKELYNSSIETIKEMEK